MVGYTVVGLPVFGGNRKKYIEKVKGDPSVITRDYVRNSSLLINLAKVRYVVNFILLLNRLLDVLLYHTNQSNNWLDSLLWFRKCCKFSLI